MPDLAQRGANQSHASSTGAVGQRLGTLFQIDRVPSLVTTSLRAGNFAVTEIRSDDPVMGVSDAVPIEDAYLLCVFVKEMADHQIWEDARALPKRAFEAGTFLQRDLKRVQTALIDQPHHTLHFYLPRTALDDLADDAGSTRLEEISYEPGVPVSDPVVSNLAASLRPALAAPEQANRLFVEHVLLAMGAHVASAYGGMYPRSRRVAGGLAQWQERRAKEMLRTDLSGSRSLGVVALECGLSVSQFSRAFKESTGLAPHRWLIQQRVEAAKRRLADRSLRLVDVALLCGFADQSHLTRVFARYTGLTPAAWRREN